MRSFSTLLMGALVSFLSTRVSYADDVTLSIGPDFSVSSDTVSLCRVLARNDSGHSLDGRTIAFEAQAWENGVLVMREKGRFGGKIAAGEVVETRIGFNGVFRQFTVTPVAAKAASRGGSGRSGKGGAKPAKKTSSKGSSKAKKRKS